MKKLIFAAAMAVAFGAFADGDDNVAVLVSTTGPDRYLGGDVVLDGECYALVWSQDGKFEGFTADGAPIDANDRVVNVGAVARNGRCRAAFEVKASLAAELAKGVYAVYVLDTRVTENGVTKPRGMANGKLAALNGYGEVAQGVTISAGENITLVSTSPDGKTVNVMAAAADGVEQPRVTRIVPEGDNMAIYVTGLKGYMRVRMGTTPALTGGVTPAVPTEATDEIKLIVPKTGSSGFYKVIRN